MEAVTGEALTATTFPVAPSLLGLNKVISDIMYTMTMAMRSRRKTFRFDSARLKVRGTCSFRLRCETSIRRSN